MNEKFKGESGPPPENTEDQEYQEIRKAEQEANRIRQMIDEGYKQNPNDRKKGDAISEILNPDLKKAKEKLEEAKKAHRDARNKPSQQEKREV